MTETQLIQQLIKLRSLSGENEVVEFKEARNDYDFSKLGKYFSALCNEANLKNKADAWMVLGVENNQRNIVGTHYRENNRQHLDSLKGEIRNKTTNRITYIEIYELNLSEGRVVMFQVPAAPQGLPVAWEGHYYGRDGEQLVLFNLAELEHIRRQAIRVDWSAGICSGATLHDLDDAAIILLGKPESEHFISPAVAGITWVLRDKDKMEKDYARVLAQNPDFSLEEIILLDKVQKKNDITEEEILHLKCKGPIEGRKPNFHISQQVAEKTDQKAEYIKNRGFKDQHYKEMILEFIDKYGSASRTDIDKLILDILPQVLDKKRRKTRSGTWCMICQNEIYPLKIRGLTENQFGNKKFN